MFGNYGILHNGLTHYLSEAGRDVWNFSRPGSNMIDAFKTVEFALEANRHRQFEILFLQTDITRSMHFTHSDIRETETLTEFLDRCYFEIYQRLDLVAKRYNVTINVIGGLTDVTADLSFLSNISVMIPSWAALVDNSLPPTSVVDPAGVDYVHKTFPGRTEEKLHLIELANARLDFFKQRRDMFWPDEMHPNRRLHRILADYILAR